VFADALEGCRAYQFGALNRWKACKDTAGSREKSCTNPLRQRSRDKLVPTSASASAAGFHICIASCFVLVRTFSPAAITGNLTACEGEMSASEEDRRECTWLQPANTDNAATTTVTLAIRCWWSVIGTRHWSSQFGCIAVTCGFMPWLAYACELLLLSVVLATKCSARWTADKQLTCMQRGNLSALSFKCQWWRWCLNSSWWHQESQQSNTTWSTRQHLPDRLVTKPIKKGANSVNFVAICMLTVGSYQHAGDRHGLLNCICMEFWTRLD